CKKSQRNFEAPHLKTAEAIHSQMREIMGTVSQADFEKWQSDLDHFGTCRMALLTGFPRSGTTLLEQLLDAHPDLVSSEERHFIGCELLDRAIPDVGKMPLLEALNALPVEQIVHQRRQYFRFMEYLLGEPVAGRMHLDKNPAYNLLIPLVLRFFPETRLII